MVFNCGVPQKFLLQKKNQQFQNIAFRKITNMSPNVINYTVCKDVQTF